MIAWIAVLIIVALLAYIRLAPSDTARWHVPTAVREDKTFKSGAVRIVDRGPHTLQTLMKTALHTERTTQLAGSVEAGLITFITRSKWLGFPDYTTIQLDSAQVILHARLRFGKSDLGVNKLRLQRWISKL
ncbi:MAG: DUF1499 domain-containing protein [Aliishimia sp.]